jgi:preprotein translocase subunit SecB
MKRSFEISRAVQLNAKLRIEQVSLFAIDAHHEKGMAEPTLAYTMNLEPVSWTMTDDSFAAVFPLAVELEHANAGAQDSVRTTLARLRVATRVVYAKVQTFEPSDREFVPDYLALNGWMHVWPYARADVQALSTRLGFPPLVLPVLLGGQTRDVDVTELVDGVAATSPEGAPKLASVSSPSKASKRTRRRQ